MGLVISKPVISPLLVAFVQALALQRVLGRQLLSQPGTGMAKPRLSQAKGASTGALSLIHPPWAAQTTLQPPLLLSFSTQPLLSSFVPPALAASPDCSRKAIAWGQLEHSVQWTSAAVCVLSKG